MELIKIGCKSCNRFGIVPREIPNPAICGQKIPMISMLTKILKICPFCHDDIIHSIATEEEILKYSTKQAMSGGLSDMFDLRKILHKVTNEE